MPKRKIETFPEFSIDNLETSAGFNQADEDLRIETNWLIEANQDAYALACDELELIPRVRRPEGAPVPTPKPRQAATRV
jgi:hypothetical protein